MKTPEDIANEYLTKYLKDRLTDPRTNIFETIRNAVEADRAQRAEHSITIDLETGAWLSETTITVEQGQRVAASILPGTTPEQVGKWYKVGDPDPTPDEWETYEECEATKGGAMCTWLKGHDGIPHVAGDGNTIVAVWS